MNIHLRSSQKIGSESGFAVKGNETRGSDSNGVFTVVIACNLSLNKKSPERELRVEALDWRR